MGAAVNVSGSRVPLRGARFLVLHEFPGAEVESCWRDFLTNAESPALYNTPEYFNEPFWNDRGPFAVLAFHNGKMVGVMTGIREDNSVICGVQGRPQICITKGDTGPCAPSILAAGLIAEAGTSNLVTVIAWSWVPLSDLETYGFRRQKMGGNVVLDLSLGKDALFGGLTKNGRRDVNLAIRRGIEVSEAASEDDMAAWWEVYQAWHQNRRKRINSRITAVQSEKLLRLRHNRRIFLARYQGKVVAASVVRFYPHGLIEYSSNCSRDEFLHLCPNDLLLWKSIQWACEQGFTKYSLGGAHHFLRKFGGTIVPIYRYCLDRSFLRMHERKEQAQWFAQELGDHLPQPIRNALRRKGWTVTGLKSEEPSF